MVVEEAVADSAAVVVAEDEWVAVVACHVLPGDFLVVAAHDRQEGFPAGQGLRLEVLLRLIGPRADHLGRAVLRRGLDWLADPGHVLPLNREHAPVWEPVRDLREVPESVHGHRHCQRIAQARERAWDLVRQRSQALGRVLVWERELVSVSAQESAPALPPIGRGRPCLGLEVETWDRVFPIRAPGFRIVSPVVLRHSTSGAAV